MSEWEEDCMRWWQMVLTGKYAHWCHDFDGLPIDETCDEYECCTCEVDPDHFGGAEGERTPK